MLRVIIIFIFLSTLLLMPQWIKIQSLLEINNTQNIQRILEHFTQSPQDFQWQYVNRPLQRHSWLGEDWGHIPIKTTDASLSLLISTLKLSQLLWRLRSGKALIESMIPNASQVEQLYAKNAVSCHTSRGRTSKHRAKFPFNTDYRLRGYVQRREELESTCLFFSQPYNLT